MLPDQAVSPEITISDASGVQAGYVTLDWNTVESATTYSLTDERSIELFRGSTPQAFVSGLADGEHSFTVAAMDGQGQVVAQSSKPATVVVQHWSLGFALTLFFCGLLVLLAIIGVLIRGTQAEASRVDSVA